jgi:hypothetical protein
LYNVELKTKLGLLGQYSDYATGRTTGVTFLTGVDITFYSPRRSDLLWGPLIHPTGTGDTFSRNIAAGA